MADFSEEELYTTLENVLHRTKKFLCQVFKRRWRLETGTDWQKLSIPEKISILGTRAFHNAKCIELIARSTSSIENCEISLLSSAILSFRRVEKYAKENDAVTSIKILRESMARKYSGKISRCDYNVETEKVRKSLERLGIRKKEIFDLFSLMKRRTPKTVREVEVTNHLELKKKFRLKTDLHNRSVNAPGEDLFQKGIENLANKKKGKYKKRYQSASYFRQAASNNHVEAITCLAKCYLYGCCGVEKDFDEAKKLFEKAAAMDTKSPGAFTIYQCNIGVAEAQRLLGSMYLSEQIKKDCFRRLTEEHSEKGAEYCQKVVLGGTIDEKGDTENDFNPAAFWFERAMENGDGEAAHNLAIMRKEFTIDINDRMMQMCFKESMNLKYAPAFKPLVEHYLDSLELDKATYIWKIGTTMQPDLFSQEEDMIFKEAVTCNVEIRKRWERQVENFESEYGLDIKGLTFLQRLVRPLRYSNVATESLDIIRETMFSAHCFRCFGTADFIEGDPMLEIYPYQQLFQLMEKKQELMEADKLQVLKWVYQILIQGPRLVPMRELTCKGIGNILESLRKQGKFQEQGELDEKLRVCCAAFNLFLHGDGSNYIKILTEGTQRYPENFTYRTFLCLYVGQMGNWKWGLCSAQEGLKWDPKNVKLMYLEAVFYSFLCYDTKFDDCVKKYENCLRNILEIDPIFPDACYALSALHLQKLENEMKPTDLFRLMNTNLVTTSYDWGVEAEKHQLDWFLPYMPSCLKLKVEMTLLSCLRDTEAGADILEKIKKFKEEESVFERKMYLGSPYRKYLIKLHRQNIKDKKKDTMAGSIAKPCKSVEIADSPKLQQTLSENLCSLKPVTLLEMDPSEEHVFKNRLLELIILVEPDLNSCFLASVAEDKDGDVIRIHVHNYKDEENIMEKFSIGSRVAVMNPYLSLTKSDSHSCIRIDDLRCVIYQRKVRNMCGFCGEEDSFYRCVKCLRIYCSEECKEHDLQRHAHNLVCA